MSRNFYFITPCGGTRSEAQLTVDSVIGLAAQRPELPIVHLLVFNNGLQVDVDVTAAPGNYAAELLDLGAVGSRAAARNTALDQLDGRPAGLVCFLDAGDRVLDSPAIDLTFADWPNDHDRRLWAFSAVVVGNDIEAVRRPRQLWLRRINNPFLIGATYTTSALATTNRFSEGAKEDWKYWLELLDRADHVSLHDEIAYEYQVISTTDHLRRKKGLLRQQYRFFSDYLGYGHGIRTWSSMVAHLLIAGTAWLRRSTRLQPWRRDP